MVIIKLKTEAFKRLQKDKGFKSDTKLSSAMGINRSTLWRVKKGKCSPGKDFIAGALKALEVTFDEIFFLSEPLQVGHREAMKTGTTE